jgi:hypothetical protein
MKTTRCHESIEEEKRRSDGGVERGNIDYRSKR